MPYVCCSSGAFANLQKATISFVMSVRLSVRPHGRTLMTFDIRLFFFFFENLSKKFKIRYNLTKIKGTLHEHQYTFFSYISVSSS